MPVQPFRFIHAARLLLDHQLSGVGQLSSSGAVPQNLRSLLEEAAVLSLQQVVDACIAHKVDFLLLSGDSFDDADEGVRGQVLLLEELERLSEHEIDVFLIAGERDPWSAWLSGLRLPQNAHLVHAGAEPFSIRHDEGVLATVRGFNGPGGASEATDDPRAPAWSVTRGTVDTGREAAASMGSGATAFTRTAPYAIGMIYLSEAERARAEQPDSTSQTLSQQTATERINYWAVGGSSARSSVPTEHGLAHDPGATQGFRPDEVGPRGCTLVEVDAAGVPRLVFVPTSPVRWEQCRIAVTPETDREMLLESMHASLREIPVYPADQAWLVQWEIQGAGSLLDALREPAFRDELMSSLRARQAVPHVEVWSCSWKLGDVAPAAAMPVNRLASEFFALAAARFAPARQMLGDCLEQSELHGGPWESRLALLAEGLDRDEVRKRVLALGQNWFASGE